MPVFPQKLSTLLSLIIRVKKFPFPINKKRKTSLQTDCQIHHGIIKLQGINQIFCEIQKRLIYAKFISTINIMF